MLDLARSGSGGPVATADVARRTGTPGKFLEAILLDLRKAGLVRSRRGRDGGHELALPAAELDVAAVLEAVDGPLALWPRARGRRGDAAGDALREYFLETETALRALLRRETLEDLSRRAAARQSVPDWAI